MMYEFKPLTPSSCRVRVLYAIQQMRSGVPESETDFWKQKSVDELYDLYKTLSATPSKVISNIEEPTTMNRAYGYLLQAIGNMRRGIAPFSKVYHGKFGNEGEQNKSLVQQPGGLSTPSDCSHMQLLIGAPSNLPLSYVQFESELTSVLTSELAWKMDAIQLIANICLCLSYCCIIN